MTATLQKTSSYGFEKHSKKKRKERFLEEGGSGYPMEGAEQGFGAALAITRMA